MQQVGQALKTRRQELNLSLKEVENATSIRMSYLQAIEEGDLTRLISHVYAEGFIKQYANFLGLDADQVVKDCQSYLLAPTNQRFEYGIGTLEHRGSPGGGVHGLPNLLYIVGFAAVMAAAWYFAKSLGVL